MSSKEKPKFFIFKENLNWDIPNFVCDFPIMGDRGINFDVPDNYAQRRDYGTNSSDSNFAFLHSRNITRCLSRGFFHAQEKKLINLLVSDFENYLKCKPSFTTKNNIKILIENLFHFNCFKETLKIIKNYYLDTYLNPENVDCIDLDFWETYMQAGDVALFKMNNVSLALDFYLLAAWNWEKGTGASRPGIITKEQRYKNYLFNQIEFCTLIRNGGIGDEGCTEAFLKSYPEIKDLFSALQHIGYDVMKLDGNVKEYDVTRNTDVFMTLLSNITFPSFDDKSIQLNRLKKLMYHTVLDNALLYNLCAMRCLSDRKIADSLDGVTKILKQYSGSELKLIMDYWFSNAQNLDNIKILIKASQFTAICKKLRKVLKSRGRNLIANYTTLNNLLYMTPYKCENADEYGKLSLMNISYMNDPNEGKILKRFLSDGDSDIVNGNIRKNVKVPYIFFKCFSTQVDYLPMWQMYGDKAKGICLVYDSVYFLNSEAFYRVCYLRKENNRYIILEKDNKLFNVNEVSQINKQLNLLKNLSKSYKIDNVVKLFADLLGDLNYLFKDSNYSYEEEQRVIYAYDSIDHDINHTTNGDNFSKLFIKLPFFAPVKEIILGPKFEYLSESIPFIQEQIELMTIGQSASMPDITLSSIDFR